MTACDCGVRAFLFVGYLFRRVGRARGIALDLIALLYQVLSQHAQGIRWSAREGAVSRLLRVQPIQQREPSIARFRSLEGVKPVLVLHSGAVRTDLVQLSSSLRADTVQAYR